MQKKKKIILISLLLVLIGVMVSFLLWNTFKLTDGKKFKKEYESLNNTIRPSDGALYNTVTIPKNNPIKYISAKEATEIIKNKTGVIYFGANWCPWCRNAVEVLFDAANQNDLDTIYYVDMDLIRNIWELKDGKLIKTQKEQDGYYELLEALDEILGENTYVLKDEDGKSYDTGEKRIYMPLVVSIKNGNIMETHVGTVTLKEGQTKYDKLNQEQQKELLKIYNELIQSISSSSCTTEDICS